MVRSVKELIDILNGLDPSMKIVSYVYTAKDIRDGAESYVNDTIENLHSMSDDEVIDTFRKEYEPAEDDAYFASCRAVAESIDEIKDDESDFRYDVEINCNGEKLESFKTYEEALAYIADEERKDKENDMYEVGYYAIRDCVTDECERVM